MIAVSEGTENIGDNGYNVIVGGSLFNDYSEHPNNAVYIKQINDYSTAAGRYQILYRYWLVYVNTLKLRDKALFKDGAFGKDAQDAIALQMINECHALADIDAGNFDLAVDKCGKRWASLPSSHYGQQANPIDELRTAYIAAGGALLHPA